MKTQKNATLLKRTDLMEIKVLVPKLEEPVDRWKTFILYNQEQDYMEEVSFYFKDLRATLDIREMGWSDKWIILGEL